MKIEKYNLEQLKDLENQLNHLKEEIETNDYPKSRIIEIKEWLLDLVGTGHYMSYHLNLFKSSNKVKEKLLSIIPKFIELIKNKIIILELINLREKENEEKKKIKEERDEIIDFVYKNKEDYFTNDREFDCLIGIIESGLVNMDNLNQYKNV